MTERLACFKAYDIRGIVPSELNAEIAERIGRAIADETGAKTAVIGHDIRTSSRGIVDGLTNGFTMAGVDVTDIGLCGTEMVYFATANDAFDAGVMVTASHNPPEYNGMKIVREQSKPISGDSGLWEIERRTRERDFSRTGSGSVNRRDVYSEFVQHLLNIVPAQSLRPMRVLCDAGNGCAGVALRSLEPHLPLEIVEMRFEPDGTFPTGVPNPILESSRKPTVERMKAEKFDFGVAWDGDYDRCFFFDENGSFIEGYYIVGLLARDMLMHHPGETIIHDPRLIWNTIDIVTSLGGRPVCCKTGHAFIKERMRKENAIYGGEMSAHHYFRSHWFCDSGMIPFLQVARLLSRSNQTLGQMVGEMERKYPCSGEQNSKVDDVDAVMKRIRETFADGKLDETDGLSIEFDEWRFNVRASNTEPVVRLNVESRGNAELVREKTEQLLKMIRA